MPDEAKHWQLQTSSLDNVIYHIAGYNAKATDMLILAMETQHKYYTDDQMPCSD